MDASLPVNPDDQLQDAVDHLSEYRPDDYAELAKLLGARTRFKTPVYRLTNSRSGLGAETRLENQLAKSNIDGLYGTRVLVVLQEWSGARQANVWMSDTLSVDLNICMEKKTPESVVLQALFLGEGLPPFILTLYNAEGNDFPEQLRKFTTRTAQLLTSSMLNFCHSDFVILPCIISLENLSKEMLQEDIDKQLNLSSRYYSGPECLTETTYADLKAGVEATSSVSYIPCFLDENRTEEWLLLLDVNWRKVLFILIERLASRGSCQLSYTRENEFKVRVVALEAAWRLCFTENVAIDMPGEVPANCLQNIVAQAKEKYDVDITGRVVISEIPKTSESAQSITIRLQKSKRHDTTSLAAVTEKARLESQSIAKSSSNLTFREPIKRMRDEDERSDAEIQRSVAAIVIDEAQPELIGIPQAPKRLIAKSCTRRWSRQSRGQRRTPTSSRPCSQSERHHKRPHADIEIWQKCVRHWFPKLQTRAYFIPPINRQYYSQHLVTGSMTVDVAEPPVPDQPAEKNKSTGKKGKARKALQQSHVREDQAQQRILFCLQQLAEKQDEVMIVLSQLLFLDFLNNQSYAAANKMHPRPIDLKHKQKHKGDFDMVIIHRRYGLLAIEIKAVGDNFAELGWTEQKEDEVVADKVTRAVEQLQKSVEVLEYLVSDHERPPRVRGSLFLPNISRERLSRVLDKFPAVNEKLCNCLGVDKDKENPVDLCVCEDQLSARNTPWEVSTDVLSHLGSWWDQRVAHGGEDGAMNDKVYEGLAGRFCGPATIVNIAYPSPSDQRVQLLSEGEAVSEVARRFSRSVILKRQVRFLQHPPRLAYVTGPPGTGKTLMLYLVALRWAMHRRRVVVLSTCKSSIAVSYLIEHMLKVSLNKLKEPELKRNVHFLHFDLERDDTIMLQQAVTTLLDIGKGGQLSLVVDEALGCEQFHNLCKTLSENVSDLRLWAASTFPNERPAELLEVKLTEALRTPPAITREVAESGVIKTWEDVYSYTKSDVPLPTDGPRIQRVTHKGSGHEGDVVDCVQCGKEVADVLKNLHVGHPGLPHVAEPHYFRPDELEYRDVFLLTRQEDLREEVKDKRGHMIRPASGIIRGLREKQIPVRLVSYGDEQAALRGVATMAGDDEVIAASVQTVNGLERKVVVWIQGDKSWDDTAGRLLIVSRSTSKLVCVCRPREVEGEEGDGNNQTRPTLETSESPGVLPDTSESNPKKIKLDETN